MAKRVYYQKLLIFSSLIILALAMVLRLLNSQYVLEPKDMLYITSVETTIMVICVVLLLRKLIGTIFKVTVIFVIMFSLYMFGQLFLNAIGALNGPILLGNISERACVEAVIDVQIYLVFFLVGVCLAPCYSTKEAYTYDPHAVRVGYWILAVSLPFEIALAAIKITLSITLGYASLYQDVAYEALPSYVKILSYFFLSGVFYLLFASPNNSKHEKRSIVLMSLH